MKKKILAILLALTLIVALAACATKPPAVDAGNDATVKSETDKTIETNETSDDSGDSGGSGSSVGNGDSVAPLLAGINSKKAAFEVYKELVGNVKGTDNSVGLNKQYDMDMLMKLDMSIEFDFDALAGFGVTAEDMEELGGGSSMDAGMEMSANIKFKAIDDDTFECYMTSEMNMNYSGMEQTTKAEAYSDGKSAYTIVNGEKHEIDLSELKQSMADTFGNFMPELEEFDISDFKVESKDDDTLISIVLAGSAIDKFMEKLATPLGAVGVGKVSVGDVSLSILMDKDRNPKEMKMDFDYSVEMGALGAVATADCSTVITFNEFGSGVEIDLSKVI
ncbi:MAG: hypothetical protein LBH28_08305 [Oscillospiraceae bacterium]|jgi:predicted small lipoprotein YifL|nr:hypothetical protein [Oscillospiraceae bacterium]